MFSQDNLGDLVREMVTRFAGQNPDINSRGNTADRHDGRGAPTNTKGTGGTGSVYGSGTAGGGGHAPGTGSTNTGFSITPSQALVIAGILGGALEVTSVLVDKDQVVEILLTGSLRRRTSADRVLDQIAGMKVDDVLTALWNRFTE